MRRTSPRFRLLVLVLALHLAHVPVPMWGAGDALEACSSSTVAGRIAGLCCWDLDLLLLGIDPPENLDEGPIDSDPESPRAEFFSSDRVASRVGGSQRGEIDASATLIARPVRCGEVISSATRIRGLRLTSYSASFAALHRWRTLLQVMTV